MGDTVVGTVVHNGESRDENHEDMDDATAVMVSVVAKAK